MPTPDTGRGPGFDSPLPPGGTAVIGGQAITPDVAAAMAQIEQQYQDAIKTASDQHERAIQAYSAAQAAAVQVPAGITHDAGRQQAAAAVQNAARDLQTAADTLSRVQEAKAKAYDDLRGRSPMNQEERDLATARADDARAQAALRRTQADVAGKTAPADIAKAQADAQEAQANAALTGAKVQVAQATTQAQIDAANVAVQQAQANVQATQIANKRGAAEATTAQAQAAVSPQLAQTAVDQAQANVNKTLTDIADLQRQIRQAPTDEQAQQAIQTQLAQKQVELQTAQQSLDQAKQLMPIAVAQGQANVGATQAGTAATQANTALTQQNIAKAAQGPIFGISDQIAKYKQMIASGQIQPEEANAAIDDWLTKQVTGASTFERQQQANAFNQNNYQTQSDFNRSVIGNATSVVGQGFGAIGNVLGTMMPGHGADVGAAVGALGNFWNTIAQKYAQPPAPQNAIGTAPVVHINIGGGPPTSSSIPAGGNFAGMEPPAAPVAAGPGQPPLPDHLRPATPQDVMANWQNEIQSGSLGAQAAAAGLGSMSPGGGG